MASSNIRQSNTLTQDQIDQVEKVLSPVRAVLNPMVIGASEEVVMAAQIIVREVEDEIHSEPPRTGKVKALLLKLTELAATGTVSRWR